MYDTNETDLIVADSFGEMTYRQKKLLLFSLRSDRDGGEKYREELIKTVGAGVYNKICGMFSSAEYRRRVLDGLERQNVVCVTSESRAFPQRLKHTPLPPFVLYCKGNLSLLGGELFAVVGSRRTLPSVAAACKNFCTQLTEHFTVVTGIAEGADTAAVAGALESGKIICVLPCGFNRIYPAVSAPLVKKVEKAGLLVSEYPPDTQTGKNAFSMRNRILAGLCAGTLVVSAPKKSGALMTANYAADYGREVFAFPYGLGIFSGEGCNGLIKNGAYLCDDIGDIFSAFGLSGEEPSAPALGKDEQAVFDLLRECGRTHIDELCRRTGKPVYVVAAVCASLEMKGLAVKSGGNTYSPAK